MPAQPVWATPRNVALLIAAYLLVHLGVRIWIGPALGFDDAEQALFAQHWLPSYRLRAPPLFTWALVAVGEVAGIGMLVISLLRYLLLAMLFGSVYLAARRLIRDPSLAALATFSFAAIYVFGYYSHHDLTHTTALSAFLAASWYAFVRLCETPRLGWYLALGLCFGLGILGKWNFVMFALALPLACLVHPRYRDLVLTWKIVPAVLVMAAVALPPALWALGMGPSRGDGIHSLLGQSGSSALPFVLAKGTASLVVALLAYPLPFLVIFLIFFGRAAWRGLRAPNASAAPVLQPVPDSVLVGTVIVVAVALHWLLVPLARATQFEERLLQPALLILPVYLFMLVERGLERDRPSTRAVNGCAQALAAVAGVALAARVGIHVAGADYCRSACRDLLPIEDIAAGLRRAGFDGKGTIVVPDSHLGGNLRVQFPEARVMSAGYPARVWPQPAGSGQCLAIWDAHPRHERKARIRVRSYLADELGVRADTKAREGTVTAPYARSRRTYRIRYALYDTPQGECR
jgi:4-amino-4-deoxy-L-arabinose transferase-like glycosyltransferase